MSLSRLSTRGVGFFVIAIAFSACVRNERKVQSGVEVFSFDPDNIFSNSQYEPLVFANWKEHGGEMNFHRMGLRALYYINPDHWWRPTYKSDIRQFNNTEFTNFGENGFLIAEVNRAEKSGSAEKAKTDKLVALRLYQRSPFLAPPEFRPLSMATISSAQLSADFSPESMRFLFDSNTSHAPMSCSPLGSHSSREIYRVGKDTNSSCIIHRAPSDMRLENSEVRGSVSCYNIGNKFFLNTGLDRPHVAFPVSESEIAVYESAYVPPRITHINLLTGATRELARPDKTVIDDRKTGDRSIPDIALGTYGCKETASRITKADISTQEGLSWYFVDAAIYKGKRAPNAEHDLVWEAHVTPDNEISVNRLSWSQASIFFPDLSVIPTADCALREEMDVKCALSVLQLSIHVSLEILANRLSEEKMRKEVSLIMLQLLQNVSDNMKDWLLETETQRFRELFASEIDNLAESSNLPAKYVQLAKEFLRSERRPPAPKDNAARHALRGYLSAPEAFWNVLLNEKQ